MSLHRFSFSDQIAELVKSRARLAGFTYAISSLAQEGHALDDVKANYSHYVVAKAGNFKGAAPTFEEAVDILVRSRVGHAFDVKLEILVREAPTVGLLRYSAQAYPLVPELSVQTTDALTMLRQFYANNRPDRSSTEPTNEPLYDNLTVVSTSEHEFVGFLRMLPPRGYCGKDWQQVCELYKELRAVQSNKYAGTPEELLSGMLRLTSHLTDDGFAVDLEQLILDSPTLMLVRRCLTQMPGVAKAPISASIALHRVQLEQYKYFEKETTHEQ